MGCRERGWGGIWPGWDSGLGGRRCSKEEGPPAHGRESKSEEKEAVKEGREARERSKETQKRGARSPRARSIGERE